MADPSSVMGIMQMITSIQDTMESFNTYQRGAGELEKLDVLLQDVSRLHEKNKRDNMIERVRDPEKLAVLCQAVSQLDEMNKRDGTRPSTI